MKIEILFTETGPDSAVPEGARLRVDQVADWTIATPRGVITLPSGRSGLTDDGEMSLWAKGTPAVWEFPE